MKYKMQHAIGLAGLAVAIVTLGAVHVIMSHYGAPSISKQPYYERTYILGIHEKKEHGKLNDDGTPQNVFVSKSFTEDIFNALTAGGDIPGLEKIMQPNVYTLGVMHRFTLADSTKVAGKFDTSFQDPEFGAFHGLRSALTGKTVAVLRKGEAIISKSVAEKVFGDANPIGAKWEIFGGRSNETLFIRDVYERISLLEDFSNGIIIAATNVENIYSYSSYQAKVLLAENADAEAVKKEFESRLKPMGLTAELEPIKQKIDKRIAEIDAVRKPVYAIALFILVAALAGFLKLLLQRIIMRRREVMLRRVHGATASQLFGLFLTETSLLLAALAGLVVFLSAAVVQYAGGGLAFLLESKEWTMELEAMLPVVLVLLALVALICMAGMALPLYRMLYAQPSVRKNSLHAVRNTMLCLQLAVGLFALTATLLLSQLVDSMADTMNIPEDESLYINSILVDTGNSEIEKKMYDYLNGDGADLNYFFYGKFPFEVSEIANHPNNKDNSVNAVLTMFEMKDTTFFDFWQSSINWHCPPEKLPQQYALLSDSLYHRLQQAGISISTVSYYMFTVPIMGTYSKLRYDGHSEPGFAVVSGDNPFFISKCVIMPHAEGYDKTLLRVKEMMTGIDNTRIDVPVKNLRQALTKDIQLYENLQRLAWLLSVVSFIICLTGIWSAIALDTRHRQKEVALRKVHGAKRKDIALLFGRLYMWLMALACLICVPLALQFNKMIAPWGREFGLTGAEPSPLLPIAIAVGLTAVFVLLVVAYHIRRVMRLNPADIIAKE